MIRQSRTDNDVFLYCVVVRHVGAEEVKEGDVTLICLRGVEWKACTNKQVSER